MPRNVSNSKFWLIGVQFRSMFFRHELGFWESEVQTHLHCRTEHIATPISCATAFLAAMDVKKRDYLAIFPCGMEEVRKLSKKAGIRAQKFN